MKYKMRKIFDCTQMPENIHDKFFYEMASWQPNLSNDCYVEYWVCNDSESDDFSIVSKWLVENGADDNEEVLIKYWW